MTRELYEQIKAEIAEMGLDLAQADDEFEAFLRFLPIKAPRRVLEIGARDGASLYAIARALPAGTEFVAVDLPGAAWGRESSRQNLEKVIARLQKNGVRANAIFGDSRDENTVQAVSKLFGGRFPDCVFIDGNHTFGGVLADWERYGCPVEPRGVVAFHDILESAARPRVKVHLLWRVLKTIYPYTEFLGARARSEGVFGIGVLTK